MIRDLMVMSVMVMDMVMGLIMVMVRVSEADTTGQDRACGSSQPGWTGADSSVMMMFPQPQAGAGLLLHAGRCTGILAADTTPLGTSGLVAEALCGLPSLM